jgi:hypothetical protein
MDSKQEKKVLVVSDIISQDWIDEIQTQYKGLRKGKLVLVNATTPTELIEAVSEIKPIKIWAAMSPRFNATGWVEKLIETFKIDYVGNSSLTIGLANNILQSRKIWQMSCVPTVPCVKLYSYDEPELVCRHAGINFPLSIRSLDEQRGLYEEFSSWEEVRSKFDKWRTQHAHQVFLAENSGKQDVCRVYFLAEQAFVTRKVDTNLAEHSSQNSEYAYPAGFGMRQEVEIIQLAERALHMIDAGGMGMVEIYRDEQEELWVSRAEVVIDFGPNSVLASLVKEYEADMITLLAKLVSDDFYCREKSC